MAVLENLKQPVHHIDDFWPFDSTAPELLEWYEPPISVQNKVVPPGLVAIEVNHPWDSRMSEEVQRPELVLKEFGSGRSSARRSFEGDW